MQAPVLNVDVLYYIMAFSSRKTLLSMMLTCHDLHRGGVKHLLRKVPRLGSRKQVQSFICFCNAGGQVAEVAYRMRYVLGLELDLDGDYYGLRRGDRTLGATAQALTQFFTTTVRIHGHRFARLYISHPDDLFFAEPDLRDAIASITTLKYLDLGDAGHRSLPFLVALKSPLVGAHIGVNLCDIPDEDITGLLRHSELSLTIMSLYNTPNLTGVACYPNVHTLDLGRLDMPTTRHYITTFPNLQVLRATECVDCFSADDDERLECRNMNIAQLGQLEDGSWRSLRAYEGSILFLYLLGLSYHVPYVHVYSQDNVHEDMNFNQVRRVVADTTPEHLTIEVSYVPGLTEDIVTLCRSPEFQTVRTLTLDLTLSVVDDVADAKALLESVYLAVSSSSLAGLRLTIRLSFFVLGGWKKPRDRSGKKKHAKHPIEVFLRSLNLSCVADRLLGSCESLQAVKVTTWVKSIRVKSIKRGPSGVFFDKTTLPSA